MGSAKQGNREKTEEKRAWFCKRPCAWIWRIEIRGIAWRALSSDGVATRDASASEPGPVRPNPASGDALAAGCNRDEMR